MSVRVDPEGNEIRALVHLVDLSGRDVLEIGCGDGRLTWRYADSVSHVTAIDPFAEGIKRAKQSLSEASRGRVEFRHVAFEEFAVAADPSTFDIAILSWSFAEWSTRAWFMPLRGSNGSFGPVAA
jgi:2-polyprenyl-3-methyl-5-hydroxy-6-metoxy-1,4-benzoquinol methylase